jgi:transposase InsO family protein
LQQRGYWVNAKRVLRLMREDNLLCLRSRRFVPPTTDSRHGWRVWPNLARGLVTRNLNELWVADITYVRLQEEFVYVAVVLDAHSRRVIGWAVAGHLGASLALEALRIALAERQPAPGVIHHSDRGIQYACADYLTLLAEHGAQPSMSRVGNPYDNAKAESFMKTLKEEQVRGHQWRDLNALRADLTKFLQITYNHQRLHSRALAPLPRFTIFPATQLSLVSLSHTKGALQGRSPISEPRRQKRGGPGIGCGLSGPASLARGEQSQG